MPNYYEVVHLPEDGQVQFLVVVVLAETEYEAAEIGSRVIERAYADLGHHPTMVREVDGDEIAAYVENNRRDMKEWADEHGHYNK